jgi:hypothetical protein
VKRKVGNERKTLFLEDPWFDDKPLRLSLPRLYQVAANKSCSIADMGGFNGSMWEWKFNWRRSLFPWEEALLQNFIISI